MQPRCLGSVRHETLRISKGLKVQTHACLHPGAPRARAD